MLPPGEDGFGEYEPESTDALETRGGGAAGGTLFGFSGGSLRSLGVVMVVLGLLFFLGGAVYGFSSFSAPTIGTDPSAAFQDASSHMIGAFVLSAIGVALFGLGGWALRFGMVRPVSSFVAEEAAPALTTASAAIGRGLEEARAEVPAASPQVQTVIKVKCKHCGYLDTEDATYCSKCGQLL